MQECVNRNYTGSPIQPALSSVIGRNLSFITSYQTVSYQIGHELNVYETPEKIGQF